MELKEILGNIGCTALGTIAPPFGGMAANVLKDVLGLDSGATEQQVIDSVRNATPEQVVDLKEAEYNFKAKLKELDIDVIELEQKDRDSARKMQVKTKSKVPATLSVVITIGFFGVLYTMLIDGVPEGEKDVLLVMLGALGTAWANVCQYWFGSSTGSKEKTDLMKI
ncbi:MAG: hypothetical protein Unbinned5081contig1002_38 [Prokaryotic dsDNA virus sp.]|nr:MAG: hypothetical protein Unbinned5081contig1002_38 [Prokaryotic dsDNA virus sp.]|tara:strand:+ start:28710 stop:29210 length:501 start_codon:yes stop_codon:yes gene_type:complete